MDSGENDNTGSAEPHYSAMGDSETSTIVYAIMISLPKLNNHCEGPG